MKAWKTGDWCCRRSCPRLPCQIQAFEGDMAIVEYSVIDALSKNSDDGVTCERVRCLAEELIEYEE